MGDSYLLRLQVQLCKAFPAAVCCVLINFHAEPVGVPEQRAIHGGRKASSLRPTFSYCLSKATFPVPFGQLRQQAVGQDYSATSSSFVSISPFLLSSIVLGFFRMIVHKVKCVCIYLCIYLLPVCKIQAISPLYLLLFMELHRSLSVTSGSH